MSLRPVRFTSLSQMLIQDSEAEYTLLSILSPDLHRSGSSMHVGGSVPVSRIHVSPFVTVVHRLMTVSCRLLVKGMSEFQGSFSPDKNWGSFPPHSSSV